MNVIDRIAAIMLSFLISLSCFAAVVCVILSETFSKPAFMTGTLEKRNYYDTIFSEYCDSVESLAIPAGVDEGVFSSVVSKDELKNNINHIIYTAYDNSGSYAGAAFDYDEVYQRFYNCMIDIAEEKGFQITDEIIDGIENVAGLCASTCQSYVTIPYIDTIGSYATEFGKYLKVGAMVCGAFFVFLFAVLFISRKWKSISCTLLSTALIADGLMLTIAPVAVLLSGKIRYIQIEIKSLYLFAVGYVERMLYYFIAAGAVILAIGAIIAVVSAIIKSKRSIAG